MIQPKKRNPGPKKPLSPLSFTEEAQPGAALDANTPPTHLPVVRRWAKWPGLVLLLALFGLLTASAQNSPPSMRVFWLQGQLVVGVYPQANEGYIQMARRVMEEPSRYPEVMAYNGDRPIMMGRLVRFPITWLQPELRGQALRVMYPGDEMTEKGWAHQVTDPLETLIQLSEIYTGTKGRYLELARLNNIRNPDVLRQGTWITIPVEWLPEGLGLLPFSLKDPLTLKRDDDGRLWAQYTPKSGDTLYSLILRFTDRERAEEINRMAGLLVTLNRMSRPEALPTHRPLQFPLEWISEDYRQGSGATITEAIAAGEKDDTLTPPTPAPPKNITGPLHVIVDAGHGGRDMGAVYNGRGTTTYEHEVVYDISLRLIERLRAAGHHVYPTIEDTRQTRPVAQIPQQANRAERVLVTPPYQIESADAAINLRVYFIAALYRRLTQKEGVPPENILLLSIHGDALAHSLRGAMVYFPDARLRAREFAPSGRVYRIRQEAVPATLHYSTANNRLAQQNSEIFAQAVINGLEQANVGVSDRKPIRGYYYRNGDRTLPAILRYSQVPASILVEVANLNNTQDRELVLQEDYRNRIAQGLALALESYRQGLSQR